MEGRQGTLDADRGCSSLSADGVGLRHDVLVEATSDRLPQQGNDLYGIAHVGSYPLYR